MFCTGLDAGYRIFGALMMAKTLAKILPMLTRLEVEVEDANVETNCAPNRRLPRDTAGVTLTCPGTLVQDNMLCLADMAAPINAIECADMQRIKHSKLSLSLTRYISQRGPSQPSLQVLRPQKKAVARIRRRCPQQTLQTLFVFCEATGRLLDLAASGTQAVSQRFTTFCGKLTSFLCSPSCALDNWSSWTDQSGCN